MSEIIYSPSDTVCLKQDDAVALVAPASGQKSGELGLIDQGVRVLTDWGLKVVQTPTISPKEYLAASDTQRAASLRQALTNPKIKAIFVTRGGYGSARLLPYLQNIVIPHPRLLLGFSDITSLHLHFASTQHLHCIHAANVATPTFLANTTQAQQNREVLQQSVFAGEMPALQLTPINAAAVSDFPRQALLTGGCLSLLVTALGTKHDIETTGKIVMIEEVGEPRYKIDRMLTHLKNAGKFDYAAAIVFGAFTRCGIPTVDVNDTLRSVLADVDCPIYHSPAFGHGEVNLPWQYGMPLTVV